MEEKVSYLREEFCHSIGIAAQRRTLIAFNLLKNDLQFYDETEQWGQILSRRNKLRESVAGNELNAFFSSKGIELDLTGCLEQFYDFHSELQSTSRFCAPSFRYPYYVSNSTNDRLKDNCWVRAQGSEAGFDGFSQVIVDSVSQFIAAVRLLVELNKQCAQHFIDQADGGGKSHMEKTDDVKSNENAMRGKEFKTPHSKQFSGIFTKGGYEVFCYLASRYIKDKRGIVAKYSNLFHFLKFEEIIISTQLEYIEFIENEMDTRMSKVFSPNDKYKDMVLPLLKGYFSEYKRQLREEGEH